MVNVPAKFKTIFFVSDNMVNAQESADGSIAPDAHYINNKNDNLVLVKIRSLSGMLALLSRGVQIPPEDIKAE